MSDLWDDLRFAVRTWRKAPGFAVPAVLILTLGIGATTALYAVVQRVLLNPLPLPAPEQLYLLQEVPEKGGATLVSYPNFDDWRSLAHSFQGLAAVAGPSNVSLQVGPEAFRVPLVQVSREFFSVLGIRPLIGRTISPDENQPGGPAVAMVSERLWRDRLGGSTDLSHAQVTLSGYPYSVVGVIPARYRSLAAGDVWLAGERSPVKIRSAGNYKVIGRLKAGITPASARAEMDGIAANLKREYGDATISKAVAMTTLRDAVIGGARDPLRILLAAAGGLLLVACLNVGLMLLARSAARSREVAMRTALGASRFRVARQILTENVLLAFTSAGLAGFLAWFTIRLIRTRGPSLIPRLNELVMDAHAWWFALLATLAAVLMFGVAPALRLTRETFEPLRSLGGGSPRRGGLGQWHLLVGLQAALAVVMLVGAGLLARSLMTILMQDSGYQRDGVLTVSLPLPQARYPGNTERLAVLDRLLQDAQALPGVEHAAIINQLPLEPGARRAPILVPPFTNPESPKEWDGVAGFRVITPDYFATLGIPLLRGRGIEASDREGLPAVTVVNASLAAHLWPGEDPLGKQIRALYDFRGELMTVVGVVGDATDWRSDRQYEMYVSVAQRPEHAYAPYLVLKAKGDVAGVARTLLAHIRAVDPEIPAIAATLDQQLGATVADRRFTTTLSLTFAALVLILTLVGIYGVVAYAAARRTREMGIRIAIGARPGSVVRLLQRGTLTPVVAGALAGLLGAALLAGTLRALLYRVEPWDPPTYVAGALLVIVAGWLSSYAPARRAGRVDPMVIMKAE